MKRNIIKFILPVFTGIMLSNFLSAQEVTKPLTASSFHVDLNHERYIELQNKKDSTFLSIDESKWFDLYVNYLQKYYKLLPDNEKAKLSDKKIKHIISRDAIVEDEKTTVNQAIESKPVVVKKQDDEVQNIILKQIFYSGYYGFYYGLAINQILNLEDAMAVGMPLLVSGGNMLFFMTNQDKNYLLTNEALWLRAHGKFIGAAGGFALSALLFGNDFLSDGYEWDNFDYRKTKPDYQSATLSIAMASSIGLGYLGMHLGKEKEWDEGRISLYRHFSFLNTGVANMITIATNTEDLRWYGGVSLLSATSGYILADKIADVKSYTRGDLIAAGGFTLLNSFLGAGIMTEYDNIKHYERLALYPAIGAIAGTYGSYLMLDDTKLSIQQGRRLNYSILGGSLIGLGFAIMLEPEQSTPYYLFPYITGILGFKFLHNYYKKNPELAKGKKLLENIDLCINVQAQNYFINKYMANKFSTNNTIASTIPIVNMQMKFN